MLGPTQPGGGHRVHPVLCLIVIVVLLDVVDIWWLGHFRRGYPLNIDESGYMQIAFHYASDLRTDGPSGLWYAFAQQVAQAPLVPLAAVPMALIHESVFSILYLELAFFSLLVITTYAIARQFTGPWYSVLAAGAVGALPGITAFSRIFVFAIPAATIFLAAIYALLRSHGLENRRWVVAFGVLLGLCPLTRTMMLGLIPSLVVVAGLQVAAQGNRRGRAVANLFLAAVCGSAVAGVWFVYSGSTVARYLTNFGYGSQSVQGPRGSELTIIVSNSLNAPLVIVLTIALVAGSIAAGRRLYQRRDAKPWRAVAQSPGFVLAVVVVEGYVALASTQNKGSGFEVPLLAPFVLLVMWGLTRMEASWFRRSLEIALAVVAVFSVVATSDVSRITSSEGTVELPLVGDVPWTNAVSPQAHYLAQAGYRFGPATARWPRGLRAWTEANREAASALVDAARSRGRIPRAIFARNDPLFNVNAVGLAAQVHLGLQLDAGLLDPTKDRGTYAAYRQQLANPGDPPNLLVLSGQTPGEFRPLVDQAKLQRAARSLGYRPIRELELPAGRRAEVLWRNVGQHT